VAEALTLAEQTGEGLYEAELHRLRGEILLKHAGGAAETNRQDSAEACFRQALAVARRQGAKSLELRAATSLARLSRMRGQSEEGRLLLVSIHDWFTEGWETPDLREAKTLVEKVAEIGAVDVKDL
jgi:predicted ATPase